MMRAFEQGKRYRVTLVHKQEEHTMKAESAANQSHLSIVDSLHCGDALLEWLASDPKDKEDLRRIILELKDLLHTAIQNSSCLDEDTLIGRLFTVPDIEFERRENQAEFQLAGDRTYTIRTTEVVDNITGKEYDVQTQKLVPAQNPYLNNSDFAQATLCCCEEFLAWILKRIDNPDLYGFSCVAFPSETVCNLVQDLSSTRLISGFCKSSAQRERQSFTLPLFCDIENLAFFNRIPSNPSREMLSIFVLRQMLESWFMRIVGFHGVVPIDRFDIRSGRFQTIIEKDFETNFHFKDRPVSFQSIQRIYRWTQASIHWAYSTNVWLLWKAVTYCERLFGATIEMSALEKYRTEVVKLCIELSRFGKDHLNERTIYFRDPDIGVEDSGKHIQRFDVDANGFSLLERNVTIRKQPQHRA